VLWLEQGKVVTVGDPDEVSRDYRAYLNGRIVKRSAESADDPLTGGMGRDGSPRAIDLSEQDTVTISPVEIDDGLGNKPEAYRTGGAIRFQAELDSKRQLETVDVILTIIHETGDVIDEISAGERGVEVSTLSGRARVTILIDPLLLFRARYTAVLQVVDGTDRTKLYGLSDEVSFEVEMPYTAEPVFMCELPCEFEMD
jgi:hypothetical protein